MAKDRLGNDIRPMDIIRGMQVGYNSVVIAQVLSIREEVGGQEILGAPLAIVHPSSFGQVAQPCSAQPTPWSFSAPTCEILIPAPPGTVTKQLDLPLREPLRA